MPGAFAQRVSGYDHDVGWFVRAPQLAAGEAVRWQRAAARQTIAQQTIGGRLYLTTLRLTHQPNRPSEALFGRRPWSMDRASIAKLSIEPRRPTIAFLGANAGLRRRLRVECVDGSTELFVINHLDDALRELRAELSTDRW
jgi:hypothetical protein